MIYLDYQSTTPCDPAVVEAMLPFFSGQFGNPHSEDHAPGRLASRAIEEARRSVASLIGASPREIVFTSGATEANNLAIKGAARYLAHQGSARRRIVTVATEHKCVLESVRDLAMEGFEPVILPVGANGLVDPAALARALESPTALVSIMSVNNETGVIQDIASLSHIVREAGALFHTDAAQAAGRIPLDHDTVDLMSLSAHKIYGPKGVGALYVRHRPRTRLVPLFSGGGQERGLRSGTLPTPLVAGFGVACALARDHVQSEGARLGRLRDCLAAGLVSGLPGLRVNGAGADRVAGALNVMLPPGHAALDLIRAMPDVAVSTGSACSSAEIAPSYVLTAMGIDAKDAARCLRLSVGRFTSEPEIVRALELFLDAARRIHCPG
ncbi:cysteine desulfurase family protein [Swaminathania salitolerans]|uniref:Cysteine desulfurase n=1 Tax=Swaminathania salitolerans TaxID=182838 RepID=A0A511BLQ3_9PROT|nr:cysteine desulfurase family protein [Swaminathania salitolerans]GBQ10376.1 cysteine desulfurase [Swaminathania salitolerans LMG 21291]GEL01266.1 IscS subfamily cysteine desulfurase [Swaminathania salitolerans]